MFWLGKVDADHEGKLSWKHKTLGHAAELQASHKGHENKKLDPNQKTHFQAFLLQHVAIKLLFPEAGFSCLCNIGIDY